MEIFIKIVGNMSIVISIALILYLVLTELELMPDFLKWQKEAKTQDAVKQLSIMQKIHMEQTNITATKQKFTENLYLKIAVLVLSVQAVLMFCGYSFHLSKYGACNFFEWDKVWNFGDAAQWVEFSRSFGFSQQLSSRMMPLYALLNGIFHGSVYTGMLISSIASILSCYLLYRLVILDDDHETAVRAIKFILIFPFAISLWLALPDSVFLALSLAAFYNIRKKSWIFANIFALLAFLCDFRGIVILFPIVYELVLQKEDFKKCLTFLCIPFGFIACLLLKPDFIKVVSENYLMLNLAQGNDLNTHIIYNIPMLISSIVIMLSVICFRKQIRTSYLIYTFCLYWLPFLVPVVDNRPRYVLAVFPLFIALSKWAKDLSLNRWLTVISILLTGFYLMLFVFLHISF